MRQPVVPDDPLAALANEEPAAAEGKLTAFIASTSESDRRAAAWAALANVYMRLGRSDAALAAAEAAHSENPGSASHACTLAEAAWRIGKDELRASRLVELVRALEPRRTYLSHVADQIEGEIALSKGNSASAAQLLLRSLDYESSSYVQHVGSLRLVRALVDAGVERDASIQYLTVALAHCRDVDSPELADLLSTPVQQLLHRLHF